MEVQILKVSKSDSIDWSASLGDSGDPQETTRILNSVLGFENEPLAEGDGRAPRQISFDQTQINEVLRTLGNRGQIEQVSNETLTTLDNEAATSSFNYRNSREFGATIAVTPTVLPDQTIRMKMHSRSAAIADDRPAVDEADQAFMRVPEMSSRARIPVGQSLVVGGLLGENNEEANLVMIITPSYSKPDEEIASSGAAQPKAFLHPLLPPRNP